ncbi:MAG TPA: hypothetical protein VMA83_03700 [Solirubrobacteraceae bacterium]|nr:hypothetical protein [Solirubrobacteraceae bacterium]
MRSRLAAAAFTTALFATLVLAPVAAAENDGRGLAGATNDKMVVTVFFCLIIFFPLLAFVLSWIQARLEKRKEERMAGEKVIRHDARWRGGW